MATKPIGTLGVIDTLTVGNQVFTDLTNLIVLMGNGASGTAYSTMRSSNASAGYTVTTGKTFVVKAVRAVVFSAGTGVCQIGYGDTDVGLLSASAPTNVVRMGGDNGLGPVPQKTVGVFEAGGLNFQIPATKKPVSYTSDGSAVLFIFGYEV